MGAYKHIDGTLGRYRVFLNGLIKENIKIPKNYIMGKLSNPEDLNFDIKFQNLKVLQERLNILNSNLKFTLPDSILEKPVNAELTYKNEKYDVKIRLAGGEMDHYSSNKWSFRCKIKNDKSVMGMREFNLMHPQTRLHLSTWICNELYKKNDFITMKNEFVKVKINGESKGIYLLEEWFDKPMIERLGNRTGIIFRPINDYRIKIFKEIKISKNKQLSSQIVYLKNIYNGLMSNKIKPNQFFDLKKFAKHFSLVDLLNGKHSYYRNNIVWYFNPITKLVEPIGREWSSRAFDKIESITIDQLDDSIIGKLFS